MLARLRKADVVLNALGLLLGIYLAAAMLLKAGDWPTKQSWQPWTVLFMLLLIAAVYVPLFSFYKYLDTRQAREEVWLRDVSVVCQEITWELGQSCPTVSVGQLAVSFWRCLKNDSFDRRARFLLRARRPTSGVQWRKGLGVAGWLWEHPAEGGITEKLQGRNRMDKEAFNQLPDDDRLGLSYYEWRDLSRYTGVVAVLEYEGAGNKKQLIGVLVIDYVGRVEPNGAEGDQIDQIERAVLHDDRVAYLRGSLVERSKTRV